MADFDMSLDILSKLEEESELPFIALSDEMRRIWNHKVSFAQMNAIMDRKPSAWAMLIAWRNAGIDESVIKSFRAYLMRIDNE